MEKINKTIKLITKLVSVGNGQSQIVPDEDVKYNFKILLTKKEKDFGFFDAVVPDSEYGNGEIGE